jgi:hypothetical protein
MKARKGQAEQDRQNAIDRTGKADKTLQTGRPGQVKKDKDRQYRTERTGRKTRTERTGRKTRAGRTEQEAGQAELDRQNMTG